MFYYCNTPHDFFFFFFTTEQANIVHQIKEGIEHFNSRGRMYNVMEMYRRSVCKFLSTLQFDNPNKKKKFIHACKINKRLLSKMEQTSIDTHSGVTDSGAKKRKHNANFFPLKKLKAAEVM